MKTQIPCWMGNILAALGPQGELVVLVCQTDSEQKMEGRETAGDMDRFIFKLLPVPRILA